MPGSFHPLATSGATRPAKAVANVFRFVNSKGIVVFADRYASPNYTTLWSVKLRSLAVLAEVAAFSDGCAAARARCALRRPRLAQSIRRGHVIHRVFDPVQLDIVIKDRFGNPVKPREWFLVPLFVVNEVVERIKDGTITQYLYDPTAARMVKATS
jgi:hypothetical protein